MTHRVLISIMVAVAGLAGCGDAGDLQGEAGAGSIGGSPDAGAGGFEDTGGTPGGGDGGSGGEDGEPDPTATRAGTIAILDLRVTNPEVDASGAEVSVAYRDLEAPDVAPIGSPGEEGSCAVFVYDVGRDPDPTDALVDGGEVFWAIPEPYAHIFSCAFDTQDGRYRCPVLADEIGANSLITTSQSGMMQVTAINEDGMFAGLDLTGMFVEIDGLENPAFNGRFPIVKHDSDYIIHVENPAAPGEPTEIVGAGDTLPTLTVYVGEGPTSAKRDFLGLPRQSIYMDKDGGHEVPEVDTQTLVPAGWELNLVNGTPQPHEFPATSQALTFNCDPHDPAGAGNCGPKTEAPTRFILEGRTTDAGIEGRPPNGMPEPNEKYATFRCVGVSEAPTLTMAESFVEAVLSTGPTRIETRLLRVSVNEVDDITTILTGHGVIGYTDIQ